MENYALITGASRGIGKSIAMLLAQKGYHLLLVARSETELQQLAASVQQEYKVKAQYLAIDLSIPGAAKQVADWCTGLPVPLSILINNAGYGLWGHFSQTGLSGQMNMLNLNINAVVELTHYLLPALKAQQQSYILNVASTAAYQAVPTLALYSASKAFILSYSRAIRVELKDTPVSVSCLCPGPTDTGFVQRAGMDAIAHIAEKFNMPPQKVAEMGIKGMFNKKAEIITGFLNRVMAFGSRHLSKALVEKVSAGLYKV
ncbi:SDR family oxidoreductase [Mucilaginibacter sp.]|uniref:SDR family NAD(P)-dependent oxidoreductase n=1 Tax=Mucilaginibacter sp. TaxID=1882438 RepID=UPI0028493703|nr:SDR family oxidoreductase [Mucilaginibacter sp.]MDR3693534.1 SDR family oxidoreductase [Mucilaginibacter sp.]